MSECEIFVINLIQSTDRLENISKKFKELNMNFEIFKAVDGKKENHVLFKKYNNAKRLKLKGKPLRNTQLGVYTSHYILWKKCLSLNKPIIIFEDDALIINDRFMDFYNNIKYIANKYECIRLFHDENVNHKYKIVEKIGNLSLIKYMKGPMGAVGYYITPEGAKKLLRGSEEWVLPVDIFMDRFWFHKVECYGALPICLDHNRALLGTTIAGEPYNVKKTLGVNIMREIFAAKEFIKRVIYNIKFLFKN